MQKERDYYDQAASWAEDVHNSLRASRNRAYWVSGAFALIATLEAVALVVLMPLKTVVPYTITVDKQTGFAQLQRGLNLGPLSEDESLTQAFIAQYIIARETIDATDLQENYKKVGLWSKGKARVDYINFMDPRNPQSVLNGATSDTQIKTTIKSISLLDKQSALVRFYTERREGVGPFSRTDWSAAIKFSFSGKPMRLEDRLINPLGFQVLHYRRDSEFNGQGTPSSFQNNTNIAAGVGQ